jgi:hypothetical protein
MSPRNYVRVLLFKKYEDNVLFFKFSYLFGIIYKAVNNSNYMCFNGGIINEWRSGRKLKEPIVA